MKKRRVRIESDGTKDGTHVVDSETGEPIEGIISMVITVNGGQVPQALIAFEGVEIVINTEARLATGEIIPLRKG